MQPIPFLRERRKQPEKPEFGKPSTYSVVKPRVSEINIGMNLNSNLIPYNEKNYQIAGQKAVPVNIPGKDFNNCVYKRPTAGLYNETFAGAMKCGLLGSNSLKCKNDGILRNQHPWGMLYQGDPSWELVPILHHSLLARQPHTLHVRAVRLAILSLAARDSMQKF